MQISQTIRVTLNQNDSTETIAYVSQGDVNREIRIIVVNTFDNGVPIKMPQDAIVYLNCELPNDARPSWNSKDYPTNLQVIDNGCVLLTPGFLTKYAGTVDCELRIFSALEALDVGSKNFKIKVEESPASTGSFEDPDVSYEGKQTLSYLEKLKKQAANVLSNLEDYYSRFVEIQEAFTELSSLSTSLRRLNTTCLTLYEQVSINAELVDSAVANIVASEKAVKQKTDAIDSILEHANEINWNEVSNLVLEMKDIIEEYHNPTPILDAYAKDSNGNISSVISKPITGQEKVDLLQELLNTGFVSNEDEVNLLISLESEFSGPLEISIDVSNFTKLGDSVIAYHYDTSTNQWNYVGKALVEGKRVTMLFNSLSPVALKVLDGSIPENKMFSDNALISEKVTSIRVNDTLKEGFLAEDLISVDKT